MSEAYRNAFDWSRENRERRERNALNLTAGGYMAAGDPAAAATALYRGGDIASGNALTANQANADAAKRRQEAEGLGRFTSGISRMIQSGANPADAWRTGVSLADRLGIDPKELEQLRPHFEQDPKGTLQFLGDQAQKELQVVNRGDGGYDVVDMASGNAVRSVEPNPDPKVFGGWLYQRSPGAPQPANPLAQPQSAPGVDSTWRNMIQRESNGQPGVTGPQTPYGRAQGMTQMLPATAQEMAQKLGVPWRPELMTGTTPEAAAYQEQLGRAYYDEGLAKYGGDPVQAASYYHGGPNENLWGPKTRQYAQAVTQGQPRTATDAVSGGVSGAPSIPGYRAVARVKDDSGAAWSTLSPAEAKAYGEGQFQRNATTGEVKQIAGTAPKGTGRLPAAALNQQDNHLTAIQTASAITGRLDNIARQISSGQLNLGPVSNLFDQARNAVGASSQQSRNFASFKANLEKLRNDSLRLNKGVQTEGDAQRAWGELMSNLNDEGVVLQRLQEIQGYNRQAIAFHEDSVTQLREDAGLPPIDTARFRAKPQGPAAPAKGPTVLRYDAQGNRIK